MLVPMTLGGAVMTAVMAVVLTAFALLKGLVDDLLLFPATMLSAALAATSGVVSSPQSPALVVIDVGAVLIVAGMMLVYLDRLSRVSPAGAGE